MFRAWQREGIPGRNKMKIPRPSLGCAERRRPEKCGEMGFCRGGDIDRHTMTGIWGIWRRRKEGGTQGKTPATSEPRRMPRDPLQQLIIHSALKKPCIYLTSVHRHPQNPRYLLTIMMVSAGVERNGPAHHPQPSGPEGPKPSPTPARKGAPARTAKSTPKNQRYRGR